MRRANHGVLFPLPPFGADALRSNKALDLLHRVGRERRLARMERRAEARLDSVRRYAASSG